MLFRVKKKFIKSSNRKSFHETCDEEAYGPVRKFNCEVTKGSAKIRG